MTQNSVEIVRDLVAHIEAQARERREVIASGKNFEPSPAEKTRRDDLMQNLLAALRLTRAELQSKLRIDRATWDRWRAIVSTPHRSYLETMARFAAEQVGNDDQETKLPPPHEMLSATPRTWGRLRLVYCIYPWKNAVLGFKKPYCDYQTATEMALLTLRGCRLVYIMSEANATTWSAEFAETLERVLGKNYAALALSKICIITISEAIAGEMPEFGLFNYETEYPETCVGYTWKDVASLDSRPTDDRKDVYDAFPATDDRYTDVRDKYWFHIQKAFNLIFKRTPQDFWSPNRDVKFRQELLQIPIIQFEDQDQMSGSSES